MSDLSTQCNFDLTRNPAGRLVFTSGTVSDTVVPVRAFPIAAPDEGISLTGSDGHERAWIAHLADLPSEMRTLLQEELANREFTPEIRRINQVSSYATPSIWQVSTDRGDTELLLKAEDHIRRLPGGGLLIADGHGVTFLLREPGKLDHHSRRILDRFM